MTADGFSFRPGPERRPMGRENVYLCWDAARCRHCFGCIAICPQNALRVDDAGNLDYRIDRCIRCFRCAAGCLHGALRAVREEE